MKLQSNCNCNRIHLYVIGNRSAYYPNSWADNCKQNILLSLAQFIPLYLELWYHMSQSTTKPTIRLVRPAKTQISLRIYPVWSESSLIACAFFSLQTIQRGINKNHCHTGWMNRLTQVFTGRRGISIAFVMCMLICCCFQSNTIAISSGILVPHKNMSVLIRIR